MLVLNRVLSSFVELMILDSASCLALNQFVSCKTTDFNIVIVALLLLS